MLSSRLRFKAELNALTMKKNKGTWAKSPTRTQYTCDILNVRSGLFEIVQSRDETNISSKYTTYIAVT